MTVCEAVVSSWMGLHSGRRALRCGPLATMSLASTVRVQPKGLPKPVRVNIGHYRLLVESGPDAGLEIGPIGEHTLIGREPWCDLMLTDPVVSAQHCELIVEGTVVLVRDLASTNGTYCGPVRVLEAHVDPSTPIRLGGTSIRLVAVGEARAIERPSVDPTERLIGTAPCMQRLFGMMRRVAVRDLSILLLGETGVGKSAIAQAMHEMSPRAQQPMVALNCAAMPADLVETTLFGHVRGAYTGAMRSSSGIFEQANGGSVLLDEIGEMPLSLQPKLLRVLETGKVRPVGGEKELDVDFRLFTATNRNLWSDVAQGRFRQDLYFRIAGLEIEVPPLRERREDISLLASTLIHQIAANMRETSKVPCLVRGVSEGARRALEAHSWPGNIRELQNVIARAMVLCEDTDIEPEAILLTGWRDQVDGLGNPNEILFQHQVEPTVVPANPASVPPSANPASVPPPAHPASVPPPAHPASVPPPAHPASVPPLSNPASVPPLGRVEDEMPAESFRDFRERLLENHGREYFESLLRQTGGNVTRASELAGISRTYFRAMVRKYGLS
jgi:DNA-binding NtrC family response regulator